MTADERRDALLEIIFARRYETIENLAFEFAVCRRTIERDVLHLSLRFPIYTTKGIGGGVRVMEDYKRDGKYLSTEQEDLLNKLSKSLAGKESEVMKSILKMFGGSQIKLFLLPLCFMISHFLFLEKPSSNRLFSLDGSFFNLQVFISLSARQSG